MRPHWLERPKVSNDPDFETTAATVIGLQLIPPVQVVVFSMDEEKAIQAFGAKTVRCRPGDPRAPTSSTSATAG
jgi:hypothetical protein